jgi:hypothetical protein
MKLSIVIFFAMIVCSCSLNIALHAQLAPHAKIVGSVITTDGIIIYV